MEIVKKFMLELILLALIALTITIRSIKKPKGDTPRPLLYRILDVLGSIVVGCSVGIASFLGVKFFTGAEDIYLSFLVGYLIGSLGEKLLNILDLKFGDFLTNFLNAVYDRIRK